MTTTTPASTWIRQARESLRTSYAIRRRARVRCLARMNVRTPARRARSPGVPSLTGPPVTRHAKASLKARAWRHPAAAPCTRARSSTRVGPSRHRGRCRAEVVLASTRTTARATTIASRSIKQMRATIPGSCRALPSRGRRIRGRALARSRATPRSPRVHRERSPDAATVAGRATASRTSNATRFRRATRSPKLPASRARTARRRTRGTTARATGRSARVRAGRSTPARRTDRRDVRHMAPAGREDHVIADGLFVKSS